MHQCHFQTHNRISIYMQKVTAKSPAMLLKIISLLRGKCIYDVSFWKLRALYFFGSGVENPINVPDVLALWTPMINNRAAAFKLSILFFFIIEYFLAWAKTDNVRGISEITVSEETKQSYSLTHIHCVSLLKNMHSKDSNEKRSKGNWIFTTYYSVWRHKK